jgi:hypothetical protein
MVPRGYLPTSSLARGEFPLARIMHKTPSQGELVLSLSKEDPRTPGFRLCKTERRRRQGHLRNTYKASPCQGIKVSS